MLQNVSMDVLTEKELQSFLKVSRTTMWRLRRDLGLPYVRVGGQYRYRVEDVDQWLSETRFRTLQLRLPLAAGARR